MAFELRHEHDPLAGPESPQRVVHIAAVHLHHRTLGQHQGADEMDVVALGPGEVGVGGSVPDVVAHQEELCPAFRAGVLDPGKQAQIQRDHAAVDAHQAMAESERPLPAAGSLLLTPGRQARGDVLEKRRRPVLVGVGERGATGEILNAQGDGFAYRGRYCQMLWTRSSGGVSVLGAVNAHSVFELGPVEELLD